VPALRCWTKRALYAGGQASDITLCAGTVDAEVWGMPLVIVSNLRDQLACLLRVNVLDNATTLTGPNSTSVAYPNDDTLYSTAFLDLRAGPELLRVPSTSGVTWADRGGIQLPSTASGQYGGDMC
jgi:hypothetical protein